MKINFVILLTCLTSSFALTIYPSDYFVLQNSVTRISLNGTGFEEIMGAILAYVVFGGETGPKVEASINMIDDKTAFTSDITVPPFSTIPNNISGIAPIYIEIYVDSYTSTPIYQNFQNQIGYVLYDVASANEGCTVDQTTFLRQNIHIGQKLVGQTVDPYSWAFYQLDISGEPLYHGNTYTIQISFLEDQRPLGVFVKYSNIYNTLPEYIQPDGTSECPGIECTLMTKSVPVFPYDGCQFDARVLPCSVRYKGNVPGGAQCAKDEVNIYSVTLKQTRSGRYVIGVQGQGLITIEGTAKKSLGYCTECLGYDTPQTIAFSIEVSSSTQIICSLVLVFVASIFALIA